MRLLTFMPLALLAATPALAQEAAPAAAAQAAVAFKRGEKIVSSDGASIGRIESISRKDEIPTAVRVIFDARFVSIPVSTLSRTDNRLVTSLSRKEVSALR